MSRTNVSGIGSPVTQLLAGSGIVLSPPGGTGVQTVSNPLAVWDGPTNRGLLGWSFPPEVAASSQLETSGIISLVKIYVPNAGTCSTIYVDASTAGVTLTAAQNLVGLYNSSGTLLGISPDQSAIWTTAGFYSAVLTAQGPGLGLLAGSFYFAAILSNGTTPASFKASPIQHGGLLNVGLAAPGLFSGAFTTGGQTTLPGTLNLTNVSAVGNVNAFWAAIS